MEANISGLFVGLALVGGGVLFWWFGKKKRDACTAKVDGVVKSVDQWVSYINGRRKSGYKTTFAYSVKGVEYVKQSGTSTKTARFSEGQTVTVLYDPKKPQRFYILKEGMSIAIPAVLIGLGVIPILITLFAN